MNILYVIEIFIVTMILYVSIVLLSVFVLNKYDLLDPGSLLNRNIIEQQQQHKSNTNQVYKSNCNFQPKKCLNINHCDCASMCDDIKAKRIVIKDGVFEDSSFAGFTDGTYCYIPIGNTCKKGYGSWVFDGGWKCVPLYPGVFSTSGKQLAGRYPFSKEPRKLIVKKANNDFNDPKSYTVDCTGLTDEYGNNLLTLTIENGLSFCLKDYCLSQIPYSEGNSYTNGICQCKEGTEHFLADDPTSSCVRKSRESMTTVERPYYSFKINCFNDDTFTKDLESALIKCPPSPSHPTPEEESDGDHYHRQSYVDSSKILINVFNVLKQ